MSNCKARQYSDQMMCGYCGLQWDVNDPDPPLCQTVNKIHELRELLRDSKLAQVLRIDGTEYEVKPVGWPVNGKQVYKIGDVYYPLPLGRFKSVQSKNKLIEWVK